MASHVHEGMSQCSHLNLLPGPSGPTCVTVLDAIDAAAASLQDIKAYWSEPLMCEGKASLLHQGIPSIQP